jgi:hypothetical protein
VPDSVTVCGEPAALSVTEMDPLRVPVTVGVKVMLMVQDALGAREPPQVPPEGTVLATAKSPDGVMDEMLSVPVPVFCRVAGTATLVVLTV